MLDAFINFLGVDNKLLMCMLMSETLRESLVNILSIPMHYNYSIKKISCLLVFLEYFN